MNFFGRQDETTFLRLLAVLILLAVVPPAVIGYIVFRLDHSEHTHFTAVLLKSLAADRELAARLIMEKQRDALGYLANDSKIAKLATELDSSRRPGTDVLDEIVKRSPFFAGFAVVNAKTGKSISAGVFPKEMIALPPAEMGLSIEKPSVLFETLPGGERVLLMSTPVPGRGAVMLSLARLTMLKDLFQDRSMLGETGESFLSDPNGIALTPLRYSGHDQAHGMEASAMRDCLKGNSRDFIITPDYVDVPTAMSYRPVEGFGGCVMVHIRVSELIAPVNAVRNTAVAVVAAIVLAVGLISFLIVKKLVRMGKARTRLEEALGGHAAQMEATVAERTSDLKKEVTIRMEAEELLRANKAFLENIVHTVHEVISVVKIEPDGSARFMWWNANGEKMTGMSSSEASGATPAGVFGAETGERLCAHYTECVEKGIMRYEETFNTTSGPRIFLTTLVPVRDGSGRVMQIISSSMDITEGKQLESERIKAQKLESLGVLAGGIAHDFNNLLAAIRLNVSMLKAEDSLSGNGLEMLRTIDVSTTMAANLTNQLLTFAKGGKPVKKAVSVAGLLRDVSSFSLRGTKSTCVLEVPDGLLDIFADPGQIFQVMNNILINADQAMTDGGIVTISAENVEITANDGGLPLKTGKYVKISIADEGEGIRPDDMLRIFDPYFTTKKKGSGLGLASSYSIMQNHNGHISVDSRAGYGAVFEIFIPGITPTTPGQDADEAAILMKSTGTVLVMDDDDLVRRAVCLVLDFLGYSTVAVSDGIEAVIAYKKALEHGNPFDAVILDLTVPGGMGGEEAVARILEVDPRAKVFVSSGYSETPIIADYRKYGFCGFLQKPYDAPELENKLRAALNEK